MKIELSKPSLPERKLVGVLNDKGTLFLRFQNYLDGDKANTVTLGSSNSVVQTNGSRTIEEILGNYGTPIYEGDEVTIKF